MKKEISLHELNAYGICVLSFKQSYFVRDNELRLFPGNSPNTCYLHFYKGSYYVTENILYVRQSVFAEYADALKQFNSFVDILHY